MADRKPFLPTLTRARTLVPRPGGLKQELHKNGNTGNIVTEVMAETRRNVPSVARLARVLQGKSRIESAESIWNFLRSQIEYKLDAEGYQYIKTPQSVVHDGYSDCKGYSILTSALLQNMGIPHVLRFVAYGGGEVTHVYVVAFSKGGGEIKTDACLTQFNREAGYQRKEDYPVNQKTTEMAKIVRISGIGQAGSGLLITPYRLSENTAIIDLQIARERMELEAQLAKKAQAVSGAFVGNLGDPQSYAYNIAILNEALAAAGRGDSRRLEALANRVDAAVAVNGIGLFKKKAGGTKMGNLLRKVAEPVKKAVTAVVNAGTYVMTAPLRAIMEVAMPPASPGFLYLFMSDEQAAQAPEKVQKRRKIQQNKANFIVKISRMDRQHFMGIMRNGIMKRMGKTPEQVIAGMQTGQVRGIVGIYGAGGSRIGCACKRGRVSGVNGYNPYLDANVGNAGALAMSAAGAAAGDPVSIISLVTNLLAKLVDLFKKKDDTEGSVEDMVPGADDFASQAEYDAQAADQALQSALTDGKTRQSLVPVSSDTSQGNTAQGSSMTPYLIGGGILIAALVLKGKK